MRDRDYLLHAGAAFTAVTGADVVATGDLPDGVVVAIDPDDSTVFIRADLNRRRARKALALAQQWIEHGPGAAPQFSAPQPPLRLVPASPDTTERRARTA